MSCPDCFRGGKAVGQPRGTILTFCGRSCYIAGPPPHAPSISTIIYFTDAFGLDLVNNKLLADDYAANTGFRVIVPDIIPGGPMSPDIMPLMDVVMTPVALFNIWGQISRAGSLVRALYHAVPFMWRARPSNNACFDASLDFTRKVKASLAPGAKLGVAGFCWGGYQSINLCSKPAVEGGSERLIDAQFCAHPSDLGLPDDIVNAVLKFKSPMAIAHAQNDFALPHAKMEEVEALLRQKAGNGEGENGYFYHIKTYPDVGHGFAVRAKPGSEKEANAADEAKEQAIEWFKRWLEPEL